MSATHVESSHYAATEEIASLVRAFESGALPFSAWNHAAHLTVALSYALHHDWPDAVHRMREGIKRYNTAHGVVTTRERGYHETLTLFWLRFVRDFLESNRNEGCALVHLANELVALADKNTPLEFYSRDRLYSWEARIAWVEPDLKSLTSDSSLTLSGD